MLSPFLFDPLLAPRQSNNNNNNRGRRLRGWMPIFDEFDRMAEDFFHDDLYRPNQPENKEPEQKQLTHDNKKKGKKQANTQLTTTNNANDQLSVWPRWNTNDQISLKLDEDNEKYTVSASVPGFNKENLTLQINDGLLTVSGEVIEEKKDEHSYSKSSRYLSRSLRLPENIAEDKITAKYENGQLNVQVPKLEKQTQKRDTIMIE
jgi:HSP20 family protein